MNTYRTVLGDTWDKIAFKMYGDERRMKDLIEANIEHRATVIFKSGVILNIPETADEDTEVRPEWLGEDEEI